MSKQKIEIAGDSLDAVQRSKLLDLIDKELAAVGQMTSVPHPVIKALAETSPEPLVAPKTLAELRQLQARHDDLTAQIMKLTPEAATAAHRVHQEALGKRLAAGESPTVGDGWTVAEWRSDFTEKARSVKTVQYTLRQQAWAAARPCVEKCIAFAKSECRRLELRDRSEHEKLQVQYEPSALTETLRQVPNHLTRQLKANDADGYLGQPRHALLGIAEI